MTRSLTEGARNLSRGQQQLLAIARALIADPRILMLDEATANIDTRTERLIQQGLEELLRDRTSIVVAHRLSTVQAADLIAVIDGGRIVQEGTHRELARRRGTVPRPLPEPVQRRDLTRDGKSPNLGPTGRSMKRAKYQKELRRLQAELFKLAGVGRAAAAAGGGDLRGA